MISLSRASLAVAATGLLAQGVQAQSLRDWQYEGHRDTRASAAITIPLGARRGSEDAKPRLDFGLETHAMGASQSVTPLRFEADYQRPRLQATTISFTLENNPRLALNGRHVATFGPRLTADEEDESERESRGLSTGEGILIGLGVLSGVLLFATLETADEITDLVDPD